MRYLVANTGVYRVEGDQATHLPDAGADLSALAAGGAPGPDGQTVPLTSLRAELPITAPGKIVCVGVNYADHAKEGGRDIPDYPVMFLRMLSSLVPASGALVAPKASEQFDYEAELLVIIGKGGRAIPEERALDHVFAYTTFNDGSVRDYQRRASQWTAGKNFDATGAVGPVAVTADELPKGAKGLQIAARLNGQEVQNATTDDMLFPVATIIATISEFATLEPGDMIATGTPEGVGFARTPPLWMKPGDVCEIEIEGIGVLRSDVVAE